VLPVDTRLLPGDAIRWKTAARVTEFFAATLKGCGS